MDSDRMEAAVKNTNFYGDWSVYYDGPYGENTHLIMVFYHNQGKVNLGVVAVISYRGNTADWAAYAGVSTAPTYERTAREIASGGVKMRKEDAFKFFPELPKDLWRA